jgi:acyl dehydratase
MTLTFEDFQPGHFGTFGPRHVTREEIIAFAAEYDPQPMHMDEAAARHTLLGGMAASGWHLCSLMMRMLFDGVLHRTASLGAPGIDDLRWLAPLRPGDDITLDLHVVDSRISNSRPQLGLVNLRAEIHNASGLKLLEATWPQMVRRRDLTATS